jgi:hypothetical protein
MQRICKEQDEELGDQLSAFPQAERLVELTNKFEKNLAKQLRKSQKYFIGKVEGSVQKADTIGTLFSGYLASWFDEDDLEHNLTEAAKSFFSTTIPELTASIMELIDKDVAFELLSQPTLDWIDSWAEDLGKLMRLTTHAGVQAALEEGLQLGEGIDKIARRLRELPQFNRRRARVTALTETLTASSVAAHESYIQSPAVTGKKWMHTGGKNIDPREIHIELGKQDPIPKDAYFDVGGYQALYPRDVALPAKERVNCHCVLQPDVSEEILGLDAEEKNAIRNRVLAELANEPKMSIFNKKPPTN